MKAKKGHFFVYFNLNLRSYGQIFVLISFRPTRKKRGRAKKRNGKKGYNLLLFINLRKY